MSYVNRPPHTPVPTKAEGFGASHDEGGVARGRVETRPLDGLLEEKIRQNLNSNLPWL